MVETFPRQLTKLYQGRHLWRVVQAEAGASEAGEEGEGTAREGREGEENQGTWL